MDVAIPAILILVGQLIRALKYNIVFNSLEHNQIKKSVAGISVGYLVDFLIPFRLGIFAKSLTLSRLNNSSTFVNLSVFVFEKLFDLYLFVIIILFYLVNHDLSINNLALIIIFVFTTIFLAITISTYRNKRKIFVQIIWNISKFFHKDVQESILQDLLAINSLFYSFIKSKKRFIAYMICFFTSWALIFLAVFVYLNTKNSNLSLSFILESILKSADLLYLELSELKLILYMPISIIGILTVFYLLIFGKIRKAKKEIPIYNIRINSQDALNKMIYEKSYIVDQFLQNEKEKKVIQIIQGGSDAILLKYRLHEYLYIDKLVPIYRKVDLENQYNWLESTRLSNKVTVIKDTESSHYYGYVMRYISGISLYEYIHQNNLTVIKNLLSDLFDDLSRNVYTGRKEIGGRSIFLDYFSDKISDNLKLIKDRSNQISILLNSNSTIRINELNINVNALFQQVQNIISQDKEVKITVCDSIHGDLTVENIIVSKNLSIVIDPSNNNNFSGPLIDISRILQSLEGGHEFINRDFYDLRVNQELTEFYYTDILSPQYIELCNYVKEGFAPKFLNISESRYINLLIASFFVRMIRHNLDVSEEKCLLYFCKSMTYLMKFVNEMENQIEKNSAHDSNI
jgi:hypothetical protein